MMKRKKINYANCQVGLSGKLWQYFVYSVCSYVWSLWAGFEKETTYFLFVRTKTEQKLE